MRRNAYLVLCIAAISMLIASCSIFKKSEISSGVQERFFGAWVVSKFINTGTPSQLGEEEVNNIIGKHITYSKEQAKFEGNECETPFYKEQVISDGDITYMFKTTYRGMGIESQNPPAMIEVYRDKSFNDLWGSFGDTFFIKDSDTLVVPFAGSFFELKRAE